MMTYLIAIGATVGMMVLWVGVQQAWGRTFSTECSDPDVLAGRKDCGGCAIHGQCQRDTHA